MPTLQHLIPKLHVLSPEFTGVGSYTNVLCSNSVPDLGDFCEAGKPKTLETYTHGTARWNGNSEGFSIAQAR